jgi:uroporphyrinogen-III synthase
MPSDVVLITRPEPGARETAAQIAAMGLTAVVAPLLAIRPVDVRLPLLPRIAALVIASGNAIDPLPACSRVLPMLTVGDATARRARQAGFIDVVSAGGDAVALAALVRARVRPGDGTLLLASGRGQSLALAAELRGAGYRVARRVVYAAVPVDRLPMAAREALRSGQSPVVLLFSAATARHFMRLVRRAGLLDSLANCEAITIGPQVGVALNEARWARIRVAHAPTQDGMLALLR